MALAHNTARRGGLLDLNAELLAERGSCVITCLAGQQRFERQPVAEPPQAADLAQAHRRDHDVAEWLARGTFERRTSIEGRAIAAIASRRAMLVVYAPD